MKDDPVRTCPECAGIVKRLLYPVGIVFKGSGWYINDSRKPDTSEGSEKSSEGPDQTDKSDKSVKSEKSDKPDKPGTSDSKSDANKPVSDAATPAATSSSSTP
jgi:predicted nucleic acid-binding Zn ribbon protein